MIIPPQTSYFTVFNFPVYYYGIIMAFSILTGVLISEKIAKKYYNMPDLISNIAIPITLSGIFGARVYYCLLNYKIYLYNPIEILNFREGGLSIHGAIIAGIIYLYYYSKKNDLNFFKLCDIISVGLPLSQAIGRWGNFFNSEAFGLPTNLPWKMYIAPFYRPEKYISYGYFHPTFLYESICDLLIFIFLYIILLKRNKEKSGMIFCMYLILYSTIRFFIETIRIDCVSYIFGCPVPEITSILLFLSAVLILFIKKF